MSISSERSLDTRDGVQQWLRTTLAEWLGLDPQAIDIRERFSRYGLDSTRATRLLGELAGMLGRALSPTLAWEYPTIEALSSYLTAGGDSESPALASAPRTVRGDEPIAVVGMACRFPNAPNLEAFWKLLREGVDAITPVPADRWDITALYDEDPSAAGKMSTKWGGFLDQVDGFDAPFFALSAREAVQMDPQQRLMLELSWEALEDAGIPPLRLQGTPTGVFFGAMWSDYSRLSGDDPEQIVQHTATGQDLSIVPARVSYTLGLSGPSVAVNTACSSSLVAVHLGCQSLRLGETRLVMAGGVNLVLAPESTIAMSKFGAMAPDGRSKAFDARANGYVRGEGGGVIALKRLSDAVADGDRVYCVIRGSAVNNDGFSNGLTAPSPHAQQMVVREACAAAGVAPAEVQYVEAHGTGTMLGDPIEAGALGAVLGVGRASDQVLRIGSVKTNIGHLEAAAGIAGLIKVALSMQHRALPPSLHFQRPNPHIPFDALRLRVQAALEPWEGEKGRLLAGVSSFGFGGTNSHIVVEASVADEPRLFVLSAKSEEGLRARARQLTEGLRAADGPSIEAMCGASVIEEHAAFRLSVVVRSRAELRRHLMAFVEGQALPGLTAGRAAERRPRVAFVFGGQGSQWQGMGRALLQEEPAARAVLQECDEALRPYVSWSLLERLSRGDAALFEQGDFVQPALFAVQLALVAAWRTRGIEPDAVIGHSMGEVAAACAAGALSLEHAVQIMCRRSQLVGRVAGKGGMAVVGLSLAAATDALSSFGERLSVGASSGPETTVVSGEVDALQALLAGLQARGVFCRQVRIGYASHSAQMDPLLPELRKMLTGIAPRGGSTAFYSTVLGAPVDGAVLDAAYWVRNLREPVLFAPTVRRLAEDGIEVFVEVDPHPVLVSAVEQCLTHGGYRGIAVASAQRDESERETLLEASGRLLVAGGSVRVGSESAAPIEPAAAQLVALSAQSAAALDAQAARLRDHLAAHPMLELRDIAFSLATRRSALKHRLAVSATSREALLGALDAAAQGQMLPGVVRGCTAAGGPGKVVFVFPGQGSQWLGMGRQLLSEEPVFRAALEACDRAIEAEAGFSLLGELEADEQSSQLARIDVVQPVLFAIEVALSALWRSWGVEPDVVVGHSMGEVAAAHVAGALTLEDAVAIICRRSRMLRRISGQGEMAVVELSLCEAEQALSGHEARLSVAVSNSPRSTVLSGEPAALGQVLAALEAKGVFCRRVKVDVASHSPQVEPLREELVASLASLKPQQAAVPMRSTVTGALVSGPELGAGYWADNVRQPVRFAEAVQALAESGHALFVEMSPHPILVPSVEETLRAREREGTAVGSLRRGQDERPALLASLGALWVQGHAMAWERLFPAGGRRVPLPTYPWQRERYWVETLERTARQAGEATGHPLLGVRVPAASTSAVFEAVVGLGSHRWLGDHRVAGLVLVPGAAVAELVRAAAEHGGASHRRVTGLVLQRPLVLPETGARRVQVVLSEGNGEAATAAVYSQPAESGPDAGWTLHATATVAPEQAGALPGALDLSVVQARCAEAVEVGGVYSRFGEVGLAYGPAFQGLRSLWRGEGESVAEVALPAGLEAEGYGVHPALLDAAFHAVVAAAAGSGWDEGELLLPFEMGGVAVHQLGAEAAWVHARVRSASGDGSVVADVTLADAGGAVVAEVTELRLQRADRKALGRASAEAPGGRFYGLSWRDAALPEAALAQPEGSWVVVGAAGSAAAASLAARLGGSVVAEPSGLEAALEGVSSVAGVVCVWEADAEEAPPATALRVATEGLAVVQALLGRAPVRLWWATAGAVAAREGERVSVGTSPVWGLGRTVMHEHPELGATLVDIEPGAEGLAALARELQASDGENQVAWRAGRRYVARLLRAEEGAAERPAPLVQKSTVLVTGGLGALGLHVARWLASQGVAHLVLTGRRGLDTPGAAEAVGELEALGARVTVAAVDVADRQALGAVLQTIPAELPLRGVIHAAGVLDDGVLAEQSEDRFSRVLSPKVEGAWNLHELTAGHALDVFVLFSSASGLLGAAGQSNYAAANTFLDALATQRRADGLAGQSLAWGTWAEVGLAAALEATKRDRLSRQGHRWMSPAEGIALFARALARPEAHLGVMGLDLAAVRRTFGASVPPVWRALVRAPLARGAAGVQGSWAAHLAALPAARRTEELRSAVQADVARVLGLGGASAVPLDRPLSELGLDSLMAVELRNALGQRVGKTLSATLAFDHPTVNALSRWLLDQVLAGSPPASAPKTAPVTAVDEPIAIVGIGCRYPGGVTDPESFWRLLDEGRDVITEMPRERWDIDALYDPDPDAPGKMTTRWGGFVPDIERFDPGFFGIAPREAEKLDPQQRLLLETSWEALERAGIAAERLMGTDTGVFVGLMHQEYATLAGGLEALDGYVTTGTAGSVASGRLSYVLGLNGPSLTVDTACSSSLVTVHLACQALRRGECSLALAGGVTLMLTPTLFVEFSRLRGLAPDGRCKSFAAAADGAGWSEGCGMLVLKRLSDAQRDGDPIVAVIRGSAVNQDGRSQGLTAPNGPSQQALIRKALAQAGVAPADVGYVEAHGTGTRLGDPIEAQALGAALAQGRAPDRPLVIGSVKSNLGHTQAAAGAAGIIKAVLSLEHGRIPKSLHVDAPSPHIPWSELKLRVAAEPMPWPRTDQPRFAAVSSFGISGTNAHLVLQEAPAAKPTPPMQERSTELFVLSAKSEAALTAQAARLREHLLAHPSLGLGDVAFSLATTRSALKHRLAVAATSREALQAALEVAAQGQTPPGAVRGHVAQNDVPKVVFVFPGQGSQWVGMGRSLLEEEPTFREAIKACDAALLPHTGFSVEDELQRPEECSRLAETLVAQPALFAIEVALAALLRSWGVVPEAVIGHSVGEIAAAHVAGILDLEQAARLVAARARIMQKATGQGKMLSVALGEEDADKAIARLGDRVGIAAINDPGQVVLSGETAAIETLREQLSAQGVECQELRVDYAFHSPQMDPLRAELALALGDLACSPGEIPFISAVTGKEAPGEALEAAYWGDNMRQAVRFAEAITCVARQGSALFVEVGPHPVLTLNINRTLSARGHEGRAVPTLRRQRDGRAQMLSALGHLYVHGVPIEWKRLYPEGGRVVSLPTYPFQRERFWIKSAPLSTSASAEIRRVAPYASEHPLLGAPSWSSAPVAERTWEQRLCVERTPYLGDHRVQGEIVFPGAGYVEMALAAGAAALGPGELVLEDMAFEQMLVLAGKPEPTVRLALTEQGAGRRTFQIASRAEDATIWTKHASGGVRLASGGASLPELAEGPGALKERLGPALAAAEHYQRMHARQLQYGPSFQGLAEVWAGEREAVGRVRLPDEIEDTGYTLHPALLDACLQVSVHLVSSKASVDRIIPVKIARLSVRRQPSRQAWVLATRSQRDEVAEGEHSCDLWIVDDEGRPLVEIEGLRMQRLLDLGRGAQKNALDGCVYEVGWRRVEPLPEAPAPQDGGAWLIFVDRSGVGAALGPLLSAGGRRCVRAVTGTSYGQLEPDLYRIDPSVPGDYQRMLQEAFGEQESCVGVVHLLSLDATPVEETTAESLSADLLRGTMSAAYLAQALVQHGFRDAPRLVLVTRGAQAVLPAEPVSVAQAPLLGLAKTIALEHPELHCTRIDLCPTPGEADSASVLRELWAKDREDQVALRREGRYVARLVQGQFEREETPRPEPAAGRPYRLLIQNPGVLERLSLHAMAERRPAPGEVLIEVEAAGLNFRDVLLALGALPDDMAGADPLGPQIGSECAGRVVAVGEGVTDFKPGQGVIALGARAFGSHTLAPSALVVNKPAHLGWEQAATLPIAFLTAHYALEHVGRLQKGERVLIHAGAGGVGLAAIQWAKHVGAEIFATAGSEEKRAYLRSLGVVHVLDSRSLGFSEEVKRITKGEGIDVVLNSLSGEFIPASLSLLRDQGRFLEIGKRDYYENKQLGLQPFLRNLSFSLVDLSWLIAQRPERIGALLRELVGMFEAGTLGPLPVRAFPASRAAEAFQFMAQAKHIGKIALGMKDPEARIVKDARQDAIPLRADRCYLITGGLGGLGLQLARWLVDTGARHLALVGRRGPGREAQQAIRAMEQAGARVLVVAADVSHRDEVERLFSRIDESMPKLAGIVHAAAVLDDHTLLEQSEESFRKVFAPKALGAFHLHTLSEGRALDFFVMYSSVAALVGSPGQGNYTATNALLDALSHERERRGLPSMSIQWGAFSGVGLAAAADERGQRLSNRGIASLTPAEGLRALGWLFQRPRAEVAVVRFDAQQWSEFYSTAESSAFLTDLLAKNSDAAPRASTASELRASLARIGREEGLELLARLLSRELGQVLQLDSSRIERRAPFIQLGLDSLMILEFRNRIRSGVDVDLSPVTLARHNHLDALAAHVFEQLSIEHLMKDVRANAEDGAIGEDVETITI